MYEFYYDYLKSKYGKIIMDTDIWTQIAHTNNTN